MSWFMVWPTRSPDINVIENFCVPLGLWSQEKRNKLNAWAEVASDLERSEPKLNLATYFKIWSGIAKKLFELLMQNITIITVFFWYFSFVSIIALNKDLKLLLYLKLNGKMPIHVHFGFMRGILWHNNISLSCHSGHVTSLLHFFK